MVSKSLLTGQRCADRHRLVVGDGGDADGLRQRREELLSAQEEGDRAGGVHRLSAVDRRAGDHLLQMDNACCYLTIGIN